MEYTASTSHNLLRRWDQPVPLSSLLPEPGGSRAFSALGGVPPSPALTRPASEDVSIALAPEEPVAPETQEEALVADSRASLTPAQMVERKLVSLLKSNPLPVSHLKTGARSLRSR